MEVSGQLHAPVALPPVPIVQEAELAAEPVWTLWRREEPLASTANRTPITRSSSPETSRYTD
jgi:hypothetical protein